MIGTAIVTFFVCLIGIEFAIGFIKWLGVFVTVQERTCRVYTLFGKLIGVIDEPGLKFLPAIFGPQSFLIGMFGTCTVVDLRVDQEYLRSQPVNSEEGAPMGIGVWYEMFVSDPKAWMFNNVDPRGSLRANVSNATVRCLSNMKLSNMLENRHQMSRTVRAEVSPHSHQWGYKLGSVYIRKVHFRDRGMIREIETKVVNRLRQVTSAIRQDGANQVSLITSTAERQAAVEFARAAAVRPEIVGGALNKIAEDPEIAEAMFEILETQRLLEAQGMELTLVPPGGRADLLTNLLATRDEGPMTPVPAPPAPRPQPQTQQAQARQH
ncbi:MAG: SPFH domain-containing protein [Candidatus Eremiobacterota bacterium]